MTSDPDKERLPVPDSTSPWSQVLRTVAAVGAAGVAVAEPAAGLAATGLAAGVDGVIGWLRDRRSAAYLYGLIESLEGRFGELADRIDADDRLGDFLSRTLEQSLRLPTQERARALGAIAARWLDVEGDAAQQERLELLSSTVVDLEGPHVRVLAALTSEQPLAPDQGKVGGLTIGELSAVLPFSEDEVASILARLDALGLTRAAATWGELEGDLASTFWHPTGYGTTLLSFLRQAQDPSATEPI